MHKIEEIKKALNLLDTYDGQLSKTAKALGINRYTLRSWRDKRKNGEPLISRKRNKSSKWSKVEQEAVIEYYFNHGENITKACRKFGYPSPSSLKSWVKKDKRWTRKHKIHKKATILNDDDKKKAIVDLVSRDSSAITVANKYNVSRVTLYEWQKELTGEPIMKKKDKSKQELEEEIIALRKEHLKLELENKVLKKANEILKKEIGVDYSLLSNKEKTQIVNALKEEYKINELLKIIHLKRSTYFYEIKRLNFDKYLIIRKIIKEIFFNNYECYGYRRVKQELAKSYGIVISEKVIVRLMKEEKLFVYKPKSKLKYSSYKGEISPQVENIVNRKFIVTKPYKQALTDITEFALKDGKVYLSPLIDCFDGSPITWRIGKSPNSE